MAETQINLQIAGLDALATDVKRLTAVLDANNNSTAAVAVRAIQLMRQAGDERDQANGELGAALDQRDRAYRERAQLLALLAAMTEGAVIASAPDVDEPGWQIAYLVIGGRQCSWHISPRDADLFAHVEHVDPDFDPRAIWDGHTTEQKYARIADHIANLAATIHHDAEHGEQPDQEPQPCGESHCYCYGVGEEHANCACGCDCPRYTNDIGESVIVGAE